MLVLAGHAKTYDYAEAGDAIVDVTCTPTRSEGVVPRSVNSRESGKSLLCTLNRIGNSNDVTGEKVRSGTRISATGKVRGDDGMCVCSNILGIGGADSTSSS